MTSSSTIHSMETSLTVLSTSRITPSHSSIIQRNASSAIMFVSPSHTLAISKVSTYLKIQTTITSTTSATNSANTEISRTESTSQPTISGVSTNWYTTKISTTASASQSNVTNISPTTSATLPTISKSKVSPVVPNTHHVQPDAEISSTASYDLSAASAVLPLVPGTQSTASKVSPTEPDTTPTFPATSKGPDSSQTPRIFLPKTPGNNEAVLASNVR